MVDLLAAYCSVLKRGIELCDSLSVIYQPDAAIDWANRTLMHNANMRMAFADRLANPKLTIGQTSSVTGIISHYLDSHWADYQDIPKSDPAKRQQVLQLHTALQALMEEVAPIHNTLYFARENAS